MVHGGLWENREKNLTIKQGQERRNSYNKIMVCLLSPRDSLVGGWGFWPPKSTFFHNSPVIHRQVCYCTFVWVVSVIYLVCDVERTCQWQCESRTIQSSWLTLPPGGQTSKSRMLPVYCVSPPVQHKLSLAWACCFFYELELILVIQNHSNQPATSGNWPIL